MKTVAAPDSDTTCSKLWRMQSEHKPKLPAINGDCLLQWLHLAAVLVLEVRAFIHTPCHPEFVFTAMTISPSNPNSLTFSLLFIWYPASFRDCST